MAEAKLPKGLPKGFSEGPNAPVQLRIPHKLYALMAKRAELESLPIATWIRMCCVRELGRRKKPVV
jgi:hypothetical protein